MNLILIRAFFVFICTMVGFLLGGDNLYLSVLTGFGVGLGVAVFEWLARNISLKGLSSAVFGIILGLLLAKIIFPALTLFPLSGEQKKIIQVFLTLVLVYLGLTLGLKGKDEFNLVIPYIKFKRQELKEEMIVVDTSAIIDGRIVDIVKTGFLEARFIIPRFILNELQTISDSTDHLKRQKGKRGIEILHELKKEPNIEVVIHEEDIPDVKETDAKLVKLAQILDAKVLTTDYNLNRIAEFQGVKVLNINDLVNALKPILLPGEKLHLKLIREGKEHNQAIGYLEDGTMVVVENARWLIGKSVDVEVTSVLQGSSGRIIFTKVVS